MSDMKNIAQKLVCTAVLGLLSLAGFSQTGYTSVTYNPSFRLGENSASVNRWGWRGVGVETGFFLSRNFSLGISGNWHVFYKPAGETSVRTTDNTTYSGRGYRYINAAPLFATGHYYFGTGERLTPYVGAGAGAIYRRHDVLVGNYDFRRSGWQFGLFPELGLQYPISQGVRIALNARYNYGFGTGNVARTSYLNANLGLTFTY
jgi:opacity protein-like surface antigen